MKKNDTNKHFLKYVVMSFLCMVFGYATAQRSYVGDGSTVYLNGSTLTNQVIVPSATATVNQTAGATFTGAGYVDGTVNVLGAGVTTVPVGDGAVKSTVDMTTTDATDVIATAYVASAPSGTMDASLSTYVLSDAEYWTVNTLAGTSTDVAVTNLTNTATTYGGDAPVGTPILVRRDNSSSNWVGYATNPGFGEFAFASQTNADTDGDGIPDYADADVDGDGIIDNGTDADGDGVNIANDANDNNIDTDGDGIPDGADVDNGLSPLTDTDGDGIIDEADVDQGGTDTDFDGINDAADLTDNYSTTDADGDGIPDAADVDPTGTGSPLNGLDVDGDGIQDDADADVSGPDTDGDGINDKYDPDTLGVQEFNASSFTFYPNPVSTTATSINFNLLSNVQQLTVTVYDATGRLVQRYQNVAVQTGANSIAKPQVQQGMYLINFSFGNGAQQVTKRIIIE